MRSTYWKLGAGLARPESFWSTLGNTNLFTKMAAGAGSGRERGG